MRKYLLAMTALTAVGIYASVASAQSIPGPGGITIGPTALSAGFSNGQGDAQGHGIAAGFGSGGTISGGTAGYSSIGEGAGTTFQNAVGNTGTGDWGKSCGCCNGTDNSNNHTYAGGTTAAVGGGATSGAAVADTNGAGGGTGEWGKGGGPNFAVGVAASSAQGDGQGFSISGATTVQPVTIYVGGPPPG